MWLHSSLTFSSLLKCTAFSFLCLETSYRWARYPYTIWANIEVLKLSQPSQLSGSVSQSSKAIQLLQGWEWLAVVLEPPAHWQWVPTHRERTIGKIHLQASWQRIFPPIQKKRPTFKCSGASYSEPWQRLCMTSPLQLLWLTEWRERDWEWPAES